MFLIVNAVIVASSTKCLVSFVIKIDRFIEITMNSQLYNKSFNISL